MKSNILRLALLIEIIALIYTATAICRDYQDSWILEGLEIPFTALMTTFAVYVLVEKKIPWLIFFAIVVRSVIVLLPNLKYDWFLGVSIDQHGHFRLVQDIYNEGHLPELGSGILYSGTPNMHLSFVIYSIMTGASVLFTFKYLPVMSWLVYPLIMYLVAKKSLMTNENSLGVVHVLKYVVFISAIPVKSTTSFIVVGTLFGALLAIFFISQLINALQTSNSKYMIIALICILALVGLHSYSSVLVAIGLLIIYLAYNIGYIKNRFKTLKVSVQITVSLVILNAFWLLYVATNLFTGSFIYIVRNYFNAITAVNITGFSTTGIHARFFELGFLDKLRIILLNYGGDIAFSFLMLVGILILAKHFRSSRSLMLISFYVVSLWFFELSTFMLTRASAGLAEFDRIFEHTLVFSPIIVGISLYYMQKKIRSSKPIMFIVLLLIALATIELYGCQPLVPPASVIGLPSNDPIVYVNSANSVYQRSMINYIERHCGEAKLIASDTVTSNQIVGLTSFDFSRDHLLRYYPFSRLLDQNITQREYDYFLIHLPGKSGAFQDQAEIRTRSLILEAINNSSIIYTNGESYVLVP